MRSTIDSSRTACSEVSDSRSFDLIESLAAAVADALVDRLAVSRVRVRVRKPRPAGIAAEWSAATVERRG